MLEPVAVGRQAPPEVSEGVFGVFDDLVLNEAGEIAFTATFEQSGDGGNPIGEGVWRHDSAGLHPIAVSGQTAIGAPTETVFESFGAFHGLSSGNRSDVHMNITGDVAFAASTLGPHITESNDRGVWVARKGMIEPVVIEGDAAPGTDAFFSQPFPLSISDAGDILIAAELTPGGQAGTSIDGFWLHDESGGLELLAKAGDQLDILPTGYELESFRMQAVQSENGTIILGGMVTHSITDDTAWALWQRNPNGRNALLFFGDSVNVSKDPLVEDQRLISQLNFTSPNAQGKVLINASLFGLTGGFTGGIFLLTPNPVPEGGSLLLAGMAIALGPRRRVRSDL